MQGSIHQLIQRCPSPLSPEASLGQALAHWQSSDSAWLLLGQGEQVLGVVSPRAMLAALAAACTDSSAVAQDDVQTPSGQQAAGVNSPAAAPSLRDLAEPPGAITLADLTQADRLWALAQQPDPPPCWLVRDDANALLGLLEGDGLRRFLLEQLSSFSGQASFRPLGPQTPNAPTASSPTASSPTASSQLPGPAPPGPSPGSAGAKVQVTGGLDLIGSWVRQQVEQALEESEAKFQQLAENLQQVFFIYQAEPYRLLYISPAYAEIWGVPLESLYDNPDIWLGSVHPEDYDLVVCEIQRRRTQGQSIDLEYRICRPDGEVRWIRSRGFPVLDAQGRVQRIAGLAEDISDRHSFQLALARSEAKFSEAFRLNPIPMAIMVMGDWRFLEVNDAFCDHWGFERPLLVGRTVRELNMVVDPDGCDRIHQHLLTEGRCQNLEVQSRRRDGSIRTLLMSGLCLDLGEQAQVLSIWRDVTDQRRQEAERYQASLALRQASEAAQAANRAKTSFLAMISHEIRTPLNAITGMASLLLNEGLPDHQGEHLEIIHQAAKDLLAMVNDILEFSHLESNRVSLDIASFDLERCLVDLIQLFLPQAQDRGLLLGLELSPGLPRRIHSDAQRLRQVFSNLLNNAIKFTSVGEIAVRAQPAPWDGQLLLFEVCDSGIGIPPEAMARLFEPFSQADTSIRRRYGGTGLGLSICDRILTQLGGQIWLQSQGQVGGNPPLAWVAPGAGASASAARGSCVYFTLPRQALSGADLPPQRPLLAEPSSAVTLPPRHLSLLLVEDVPLNQQVGKLLLQNLGYSVDLALDGQAALAHLEHRSYDIIFLDIQMPGLNGYDTSLAIRQRLSQRRPWIIGMSAAVEPSSRDRAQRCGMDDFLPKPVHRQMLVQALGRYWSQALAKPTTSPGAAMADGPRSGHAIYPTGQDGGDRAPTLSLAVLQEVEGWCSDRGFFVSLLATYRRDGEQQITALWTALARQDLDAVIYLAHSLGPASATLGGLRLWLLCQGLEAEAQSAQSQLLSTGRLANIAWTHLTEAVQEVELEYERLCEHLLQQTQ